MGRRNYLLVVGLVLIVIGLLITIFWQRRIVRLQPLLISCEKAFQCFNDCCEARTPRVDRMVTCTGDQY